MKRAKNEDNKVKCLLLCPEYLDLQKKIYDHLLYNHGSEITIVGVISNPGDISQYDFSLLFTTIELDRESDFETCYIPPMVLSSSTSAVNEKINIIKTKNSKTAFLKTFDRYFNRDLFICNPDVVNETEAINLLCGLLEKNGYIQNNFKQLVLDRENMAKTAFNYLAIPHPIKPDAIKTQVAVIVDEAGINWGGNKVHIVMLPAITDLDKQYISDIYSVVLPIFGN